MARRIHARHSILLLLPSHMVSLTTGDIEEIDYNQYPELHTIQGQITLAKAIVEDVLKIEVSMNAPRILRGAIYWDEIHSCPKPDSGKYFTL